jgi:FkbM family methyltransferase
MIKKNITLIALKIFDYYHNKKIINFLKKKITHINILLDIGAHKGESVRLFINNFSINYIHSFEPSFNNYNELKKNIFNYKKKFKKINFKIYNYGFGETKKDLILNQTTESSSSTFNKININSKYYKKKISYLKNNKVSFSTEFLSKIDTLDNFFKENKLSSVDIIKIDTEGYEYSIFKGFIENFHKAKFIFFEHHYDNMLIKNYTFLNIAELLKKNNFIKIYKSKMPFRKTFEYIYANQSKI